MEECGTAILAYLPSTADGYEEVNGRFESGVRDILLTLCNGRKPGLCVWKSGDG